METATKVLYGSKTMIRMYCSKCKTNAFVIDGILQCCDSEIEMPDTIEKEKRESTGEQYRSRIPAKIKKAILESQNNKCIYCNSDLDGWVLNNKKNKYIKIRTHFDHFICWNYSRDNHQYNLVASCHICNGIKSDKCFYDIISTKDYINEKRRIKGYSV